MPPPKSTNKQTQPPPFSTERGLDARGHLRIVRASIGDGTFAIHDENILTPERNMAFSLRALGLMDKESASLVGGTATEASMGSRVQRTIRTLGAASMPEAIHNAFYGNEKQKIFSVETAAKQPALSEEELFYLRCMSHNIPVTDILRFFKSDYRAIQTRRDGLLSKTGALTLTGAITIGHLSGLLPSERPNLSRSIVIPVAKTKPSVEQRPDPDTVLSWGNSTLNIRYPRKMPQPTRTFILQNAEDDHGESVLDKSIEVEVKRAYRAENCQHLITRCFEENIFDAQSGNDRLYINVPVKELSVVWATASGEPTVQIARRLGMSPNKVAGYRNNFMKRVEAPNMNQAITIGHMFGILPVLRHGHLPNQNELTEFRFETPHNKSLRDAPITRLAWRGGLLTVNKNLFSPLTTNILALRSMGLENDDVIKLLEVTRTTIDGELSSVFDMLKCKSMAQTVVKLFDCGFFRQEVPADKQNFVRADLRLLIARAYDDNLNMAAIELAKKPNTIKNQITAVSHRVNAPNTVAAITLARMCNFLKRPRSRR